VVNDLAEQQHFAQTTHVGLIDHSYVRQVTLLLFGLFRQDVTLVSVFTLNFTRSGKSESFFSTGISLYLWHFF
jgi:hypothetical protein